MQRHYCKPEAANGPVELYSCRTAGGRKALLSICGMGKVAAAVASQWLLLSQKSEAIINVGVCGILDPLTKWSTGQIFQIRQVVEGDHELPGLSHTVHVCAPLPRSDLPSADLVTVDKPVFRDKIRQQLAAMGSLVDMEGAAVVRVARIYNRPAYLIKGVTDFAANGQRSMLYANLDAVSVRLAETITRIIDFQL